MSAARPLRVVQDPETERAVERADRPNRPSEGPNAQARVRGRARVRAIMGKLQPHVKEKKPPKAVEPEAVVAAKADPVRSSLWSQAPASVADIAAYTRAGAWAPGDQAPIVEAAGKAYGWCVAIPVTVTLYSLAWLLQRPGRLAVTTLIAGVVVITSH